MVAAAAVGGSAGVWAEELGRGDGWGVEGREEEWEGDWEAWSWATGRGAGRL